MTEKKEKRSTRGQRISELVGEAAEADAAFWGLSNEIWKEEEESEDESFEAEVEKPDVFDSDFNDTETDDDEESDGEKELKRGRKNDNANDGGRAANRYKEPTKVAAKKKEIKTDSVDVPQPSADRKKRKEADVDVSLITASRTVRESTKLKSNDAWTKQANDLKLKAQRTKTERTIKSMFNQKDLLMEGLDTESLNAKWLHSQKLIQDEKIESEKPLRDTSTENFIKFHSKRGCYNTITFTSADSMPSVFTTRKQPLEANKPKVCVITGLPAKYRDPRTNLSYATIKAYKEIKKRFHGRHSAASIN